MFKNAILLSKTCLFLSPSHNWQYVFGDRACASGFCQSRLPWLIKALKIVLQGLQVQRNTNERLTCYLYVALNIIFGEGETLATCDALKKHTCVVRLSYNTRTFTLPIAVLTQSLCDTTLASQSS